MVVLKNTAHCERYVSGIFVHEVIGRKIMRVLKVESI